jgi:hypothetical protein
MYVLALAAHCVKAQLYVKAPDSIARILATLFYKPYIQRIRLGDRAKGLSEDSTCRE